jgi:adenylosuccinate lyase
VRWLQALANRPEIIEVAAFSAETNAALDAIVTTFLKKMQTALKKLNVQPTMM